MLLTLFIDTAKRVDAALDRPQHRRQQGALTGEDQRHVRAEGLHQERDDRNEDRDLEPAIECHQKMLLGAASAKTFPGGSARRRDRPTDRASPPRQAHNRRSFWSSSDPVAANRVQDRNDKEG